VPFANPSSSVFARKAAGKHGAKETSEEQYGKALERRFKSLVGEPEWAKLDRPEQEDGDSDDEFFRNLFT
jgi:hypothetical protein